MSGNAHRPATIPSPIPAKAGVGLRFQHHEAMREMRPPVGWLEIHSENYMGGGWPLACLTDLRRDYPISLHGVGLSLGSAEAINTDHLARIKALARRIEPGLISEHLAWTTVGGDYLNDLLPLPYTHEALDRLVEHIDQMQNFLDRRILIENPSTYLTYRQSEMSETEFIAQAVARSGCGLLLDLNNIYVSARNHGTDPMAYLAAIPPQAVEEIHLAGHSVKVIDGIELRIDDHGSAVADPVWQLYDVAVEKLGPRPTLIEWDSAIPDLSVLVGEAATADRRMLNRARLGRRHAAA